MNDRWVNCEQLAWAASISRQKAHRAVSRAFLQSCAWRGAKLIVRQMRAPSGGGRAGLYYEVQVDSLPLSLQERFKGLATAVEQPVQHLSNNCSAKRNWYLHILGPALNHPPRSTERCAAIDAILGRPLTNWNGQPIKLSRRTIERLLANYKSDGIAAFVQKVRADKGRVRVFISRTAEQAIPLDDEAWENIAAKLRNYIRGHWKANATLKLIQGRANIKFHELVEAAGFDHCRPFPDSIFIVPRRFIEAERRYRHVHILNRDRKKYEDNRFRTLRSRSGMMPMDWVIGDVHPVDIVMNRKDGSTAHARMLGWLDCATNRMRFNLVLCEPGTGIRNADLVQSFCHMLEDPAWGIPKTLYIDNGREYRFAEDMNDALQLVAQLRGGDGRATRVVRATPYNAAAKPIEGVFALIEKALQDIPGYTGGNRINKKTERVGRPTKAFLGTLEQLHDIIRGRLSEIETYPMRGILNGRSPRQAYEDAISSGWQPVSVDPREIRTVFAIDRICKISKGVITFDNRRWACDEMNSYFEDKIIARVPRFLPADQLPLLHIKTRELIGIAEPVGAFTFDDPAGAILSKKMDKSRRMAIQALNRSAPNIDTVHEGLRLASTIPAAPIAVPIARISLSKEAQKIATASMETTEARTNRQRQKDLKARRRQSAALDSVLQALKGNEK